MKKIKKIQNVILIILVFLIVIVVMLFLLTRPPSFWLGPNSTYINGCIQNENYSCQNPTLISTTGNLTVTIQQNTKVNWTNVYFGFDKEGISYNAIYTQSLESSYYVNNLNSGDPIKITLSVDQPGIRRGTLLKGFIWAKYNTSNQSVHYAYIGAVDIPAT